MFLKDEVTVTCRNCNKSKKYTRLLMPQKCEFCGEPYERGEFGRDWFERSSKTLLVVGGVTASTQLANFIFLEALYPGISRIFTWQFSITTGVFLFTFIILSFVAAFYGRYTVLWIRNHVRLILFLCFFFASVISIPITLKAGGYTLETFTFNLIVGLETNILASFTFVVLYEILVKGESPWTAKKKQ